MIFKNKTARIFQKNNKNVIFKMTTFEKYIALAMSKHIFLKYLNKYSTIKIFNILLFYLSEI